MLWCDRVAPLGKPVVPDVYWMLIGSSNDSAADRSDTAAAPTPTPLATIASHDGRPITTTSRSAGQSPWTSATIPT